MRLPRAFGNSSSSVLLSNVAVLAGLEDLDRCSPFADWIPEETGFRSVQCPK